MNADKTYGEVSAIEKEFGLEKEVNIPRWPKENCAVQKVREQDWRENWVSHFAQNVAAALPNGGETRIPISSLDLSDPNVAAAALVPLSRHVVAERLALKLVNEKSSADRGRGKTRYSPRLWNTAPTKKAGERALERFNNLPRSLLRVPSNPKFKGDVTEIVPEVGNNKPRKDGKKEPWNSRTVPKPELVPGTSL